MGRLLTLPAIIDKGGRVMIIPNALACYDTAVNTIVKSFIVPVGQISAIRGHGHKTFFFFYQGFYGEIS